VNINGRDAGRLAQARPEVLQIVVAHCRMVTSHAELFGRGNVWSSQFFQRAGFGFSGSIPAA
jgi:hypothetical protein